MKHISFLAMLLIAANLFAGHVEYTYHFNAPQIKAAGQFQAVVFEDTYLTGPAGGPALPYQGVRLLLPPGEEAVSVSYVFENEIRFDAPVNIYPQQPSRPLSSGTSGVFHQDLSVYASEKEYPSTSWGEHTTHFMNGHSFLLSSFTPVRYIPATGQVSYFTKVTVKIETRATERSTRALAHLNTKNSIIKRTQDLAQNPEMITTYPSRNMRDEGYQALIITPQSFQGTFQQLQDFYLIRGFKTEIATIEYIGSNTSGQDMQEKIRNYIIQEYQQNGIEYVVLGGDNEYVPHRGFYCYVISGGGYEDSNIPSDLYYSALDGNWNNDGDWYWGEIGEDDLLPDVAVARFPVSTVAQLEKMIHKTTLYQDNPVEGELQKPIIAGENLWSDPLTYGEDYLELLIGEHSDNGYTTIGMPETYNFQKLYDHLEYWDGSTLMQTANQGSSFIHHSGHANQTYLMRWDITQINNANFSQVNGISHNYALVYSHGCLCGAFDENDCIGEAMVLIDNFAVAGAFNSRYGWFNEGQTEGPSAHLHREFVDALYNDKECHIGAAHMISRIATSPWVNAPGQWEEGALRWCFYCCNILGDPLLGVWTDEPIDIETDYPEEILIATTSISVTVTSNGQPVAGENCVVMGDGEMLGMGVTDDAGQCVISIPQGFDGIATAELVVSGYNTLAHHYPLSIQVGLDEKITANLQVMAVPNPFTDKTTIVVNTTSPVPASINFYNISGQKIGSQREQLQEGSNQIRPDVSSWPAGVIIMELIAGSQVTHQRIYHLGK